MDIFGTFRSNTNELFVVNSSNVMASKLSVNAKQDFSIDENSGSGYIATNFNQQGIHRTVS